MRRPRGRSSKAELQPSKLAVRVRFPSPAPSNTSSNLTERFLHRLSSRACRLGQRHTVLSQPPYWLEPVEQLQEQVPHRFGIHGVLEEHGHTMTRIREEISARMPRPDERSRLRLPPGVPVLDVLHTSIDQDGHPYELTRFVLRADLSHCSAEPLYFYPRCHQLSPPPLADLPAPGPGLVTLGRQEILGR
jgi:UTRA domain